MDIIGSKITAYQETRSWKKKHEVLMTALTDFVTFTKGKGRFLTNATAQLQHLFQNETTPPEGCWIQLPLASPLLMQKVRTLLMNHIRRLEKASILVPSSSLSFSRKNKNHRGLKQQARAEEKKVIKKRENVSFSLPPPPPPPCLVTTTGKSTLFSIFDDDIIDNDNYLNIDIDVDNIQNNDGDDNRNYDIDGNGDTNGDSNRLHQVVNAIVVIDDSLNREGDELFMNSVGDEDNQMIDHHCYDMSMGDVGDGTSDDASLACNLEDFVHWC
mmetsp:Transcript_10969/g.10622  ORF Transcript_10969/g.10622 Transcript_10969/m.10622 type:complete len:271 (-) Transcript_10969:140-952(-)